jgi:ABC-type glycerol-3-phosphate transport system permease component
VVTKFVLGDCFYLGPMMAGATLESIPAAILFFFLDLQVSGLIAGAVKG